MAHSELMRQGRKQAESRVNLQQFTLFEVRRFLLLSAVKQTPSGLLKKVLELPEGSTVGDALRALGWQKTEEIGLSIYGRRCKEEDLLKDGDRIELTEPLRIDPKEARRLRALNKPLLATRGRKHAK